ncbi:cytosine permease [Altererythrobacter sp. GH1-8]|uniref:cytosine permease n=1 Tax=Altererythrobacter sp. GH1-8 TaxID=3349333 RepID=UPI00374D49D9
MAGKFKQWWSFDPEAEASSADNPHAPLRDDQRRETFPLLTLAFGWGFLVTGLIVGGALGKGLPFADIVTATFLGNSVNFVIGALVAYVGYKTACNSGLLYRQVFGTLGAAGPVILVALLTIGWQGIIVGAFGFAWTQSFDTASFYAVAIFAGLLFTMTTYFGVKGLEAVSIPATLVLVAVGIYAGWMNVSAAGGWEAFLSQSEASAGEAPLTMVQAVNLVIGSWIVGAIVMPEYSRFAKKAWVAIAIPFIVLILSQWFLQIVGAMGGIVSGTHDFTTYMLAQGAVIGGIGVIAMSLALWTTGDANLYLPAVQTASVFKRPQRVMTVLCGIAGTIIGLGIYEQFLFWIDLLATIAPPLIGPLLAEFYLGGRKRFDAEALTHAPVINPLAFIAYAVGVIAALNAPENTASALVGLIASVLAYWMLSMGVRSLGKS